jgi:hypothetical protein
MRKRMACRLGMGNGCTVVQVKPLTTDSADYTDNGAEVSPGHLQESAKDAEEMSFDLVLFSALSANS